MAKTILIKPVITEKAEMLSEGLGKYSFVVSRDANKLEVRSAVEEMYGVTVDSVNTMIMPSRVKTRMTRSGMLKGKVSGYKKAVVTLADGEEIDFFGDI